MNTVDTIASVCLLPVTTEQDVLPENS